MIDGFEIVPERQSDGTLVARVGVANGAVEVRGRTQAELAADFREGLRQQREDHADAMAALAGSSD